ncbi:MAG: T9SS type A sorting domain-containing protein, partial [Ignavibacteria bacterium]|nr:T9SS type A sorting domain-containing protein [Ignavibacteria bacterium]
LKNNLAKLNNTTGAADPVWEPNSDGSVLAIAQSGNDLYVGGGFYSIGGRTRNRIAKINNITGVVDTTWNPNINNFVNTLVINNNDLYVSGIFTTAGGLTRNRLVKIDKTTGAIDAVWNPNANNDVYSLVISGSDIYAGGNFTSIGGQTRNYIAKLNNTNGNADGAWNPNSNGPVLSIATDGSDIYAGGAFSNIGGLLRNNIAKLNSTTGDADAGWDANANSFVYSIAISGTDVYAGGNFNVIGFQTRSKIAKLNSTNGFADLTWNANVNNTGYVLAITVSGSDVYVGGSFTLIGTLPRDNIARLNNTTGTADVSWYPNANAGVFSVTVSGDDVYAGGGFTTMGGNQKRYFSLFTNRVLPVELTSFTSSIDKQNVTLIWNTSREENNLGFEIERKSSETEWKKTGFVNGSGTTNEAHNYSFKDNNLSAGKYSYRLKQTDYNGNYKYFYLQNEITIGIPKTFSLSQNYPNPFNPSCRINYQIPAKGFVELNVYDIVGKKVASLVNGNQEAGTHLAEFDGSALASGVYFYKLNFGTFSETKKMLLLK